MSQSVHTFDASTLEVMQEYYKSACIHTPQGAIFRAKTDAAVITAYQSGKVLFQGKAPEIEVKKWVEENNIKENKSSNTSVPKNLFTASHIGSDEAGTGDYFGPITVAAVYVQANQIDHLRSIGVRDSKNISDQQIQRIAKQLMDLNIPYVLHVLPNHKYNELQKNGWTQGKMKTMMHHYAIQNLVKKIEGSPLDGILIDQFCQPHVFQKHLASEEEKITAKTYFMTKAESYSIAVAAASIIARTKFLTEMKRLSNEIGIPLPKGASSKVDLIIAEFIKKHGQSALDSFAKVHFANTKKAAAYLS